jgi:hypothetical protein
LAGVFSFLLVSLDNVRWNGILEVPSTWERKMGSDVCFESLVWSLGLLLIVQVAISWWLHRALGGHFSRVRYRAFIGYQLLVFGAFSGGWILGNVGHLATESALGVMLLVALYGIVGLMTPFIINTKFGIQYGRVRY